MLGGREVQHEGEDVERRTKLYTLAGGGRQAVESSKSKLGQAGAANPDTGALNPRWA